LLQNGVSDRTEVSAVVGEYGRTRFASQALSGARDKQAAQDVHRCPLPAGPPRGRSRRGLRAAAGRMGVAVGHDDREHQARRRVELARRGSAHERFARRQHRSYRIGLVRFGIQGGARASARPPARARADAIEEHLAAYGAVEPREAREPSGRGGSRNATYGQTSHRQRASCATTSTSDHGGRK